jgi:predicted nucleic acid-binding protein
VKYALDTNLYISAIRDVPAGEALERFSSENLPSVYLHAVVVQELLAGAIDVQKERALQSTLINPFERRRRIVTPSYRAWRRVGEIIAHLLQQRIFMPGAIPRSFTNDCLIATSCREAGVTLVTNNLRDFELIQTIEPVEVVSPWPN